MFPIFADRREAGFALAEKLEGFVDPGNSVILALPRGGVPVAKEVSTRLHIPLDIITVRKVGAPGHEEFAVGAIAEGGEVFIDAPVVHALRISPDQLEKLIDHESAELSRRERLYRGERPMTDVSGKTVFVIDDGLATGATMKAAVNSILRREPKEVVIAVPVAAAATCREFDQGPGIRCLCVSTPEPFHAVGLWYRNFGQTSDAEVIRLLDEARAAAA